MQLKSPYPPLKKGEYIRIRFSCFFAKPLLEGRRPRRPNCRNHIDKMILHKLLVVIITFLPPVIISVFFPNIFLKAIGIVGGIGIAILFGILPSIVFFIKTKSNPLIDNYSFFGYNDNRACLVF